MKICFKCGKEQEINNFYKHKYTADGYLNKCKECSKKDVRKYYQDNLEVKKNYDNYRLRHSITRIFNHRYSGIKRRCLIGRSDKKPYSTTGKVFLSKEEWLEWCYKKDNYKKFVEIYNKWVQAGFIEKLSPSVDRIDNKKSYITSNIQWLSKSDNCIKHNKHENKNITD